MTSATNGRPDFSPAELQAAARAMAVVQTHGDPDEWTAIQRQAREPFLGSPPWWNATTGQQLNGCFLARELASLLGVPFQDAERAIAARLVGSPERALFDALLAYAAELGDRPEPLPDAVLGAFAATVAADPVPFGRIVLTALQSIREAEHASR